MKPKPSVLSRPGVPFLLVIFACGCVRPLLLPSAGVNTLSNPADDLGVTLCRSADKRSVVLLQTNWEDNGALKRVTELDGPSASGCKVQHHNVCQDNVPDPGHYVPGISAGRNDIRDLGRQVPSPCVGCNGAPGYGADRDGALASVCEVSGHGAGQDGTPGPGYHVLSDSVGQGVALVLGAMCPVVVQAKTALQSVVWTRMAFLLPGVE